jgi:hypothetical protein
MPAGASNFDELHPIAQIPVPDRANGAVKG